jgi:hypothetical protein
MNNEPKSPMACGTAIRCEMLETYAPEPEGTKYVPFLSELEYLIAEHLVDDKNNDAFVTRIASLSMYEEEENWRLDALEGKIGRPLYDRSIEDVKHETPSYAYTQDLCALAKHGLTRLQSAKETFSRVIIEKMQEPYALEGDQEFVYPEHYGESYDRAMTRPESEKMFRVEEGWPKFRKCLQGIERAIWLSQGIGSEENARLQRARARTKAKEKYREAGRKKFAAAWNCTINRTFYEVKSVPDSMRCLNGASGCPTKCKLGKDGYC